MRQVAGTREVAAVLIHFDAIVVEDVVVETGEKSNLVLAVRLTIFAIAEKRVVEGNDPFETVEAAIKEVVGEVFGKESGQGFPFHEMKSLMSHN